MFIDYLKLSYLIQDNYQGSRSKAYWLAVEARTMIKVTGITNNTEKRPFLPYGCTHVEVMEQPGTEDHPGGSLVVLHWGGSVLPTDLNDFCREFKKFKGWTISRLDLADNVNQLSKGEIRHGKTQIVHHWYTTSTTQGGETIEIWTGSGLGKRGSASSYFRCYDARKHEKGIPAKLARFGRYDFWRIEYELGRKYWQRKGIKLLEEILNPDFLWKLWLQEIRKKGVFYKESIEYESLKAQSPLVENDILTDRKNYQRRKSILAMLKKLDKTNLEEIQIHLSNYLDSKRKESNEAH